MKTNSSNLFPDNSLITVVSSHLFQLPQSSGSQGTETINGGKGRKQSSIPLQERKTGTFASAQVASMDS